MEGTFVRAVGVVSSNEGKGGTEGGVRDVDRRRGWGRT
jgi:hypothetical protein